MRINGITDIGLKKAYRSLSPSVISYKRLAPPSAQALKRALNRKEKKKKSISTQEAQSNSFQRLKTEKQALIHIQSHFPSQIISHSLVMLLLPIHLHMAHPEHRILCRQYISFLLLFRFPLIADVMSSISFKACFFCCMAEDKPHTH